MSRTRKSLINIAAALGGQAGSLLISVVARYVFVKVLAAEFLGINGLFSNMLNMLSLAELGIGAAITYSLYRPIAIDDTLQIRALMDFFRKAYITIGLVIFSLGVALTPFLEVFIKDPPQIPQLRLYFLLFVVNNSISYFYSYKRSLIIASQREYVSTAYHFAFFLLRNIIQITVLLTTADFLLFLLIQLGSTILENIFISRKADAMFPYLKGPSERKLDSESLALIKKNTLAMVFHRLGSVIVFGTDNLLISKLVGIVEVGFYSNYYLIIGALNRIYIRIFRAMAPSIGNIAAAETPEKARDIFQVINFLGFWIYGFSSICLVNLLNPFICLWLGEGFLFSMPMVLVIVLNFYLTGMRRSVLMFRDAYGLFWNDRYKPLFESFVNLIASILLYYAFGMIGIFIGTTVSTLSTCFWIEPFVLYKHGFKSPVWDYFRRYILYCSVLLVAAGITCWLNGFVPGHGIKSFVLTTVICFIAPNLVFGMMFSRTKEFRFLFEKVSTISSIRN